MEQCRKAGKSHWYHETQSTMSSQTTLSLMPEAAYVNDRFLLDLAVSETALAPFESWLKPARQLANILFPRTVLNDRLHTFSAYERMSTALTAAQVFGVQRLCRHYAARLAPLPGPDASRESNQRLAQITQYARQLAGSPSVINTRAREQLAEVGLTARDTVLINQIIGFVGFQARVAAIFQAFCRLPVRELPGQEMQRFARAALFQNPQATWRPADSLVEYPPAHTKVRRQYSSSQCQKIAPVLLRDPSSFALLERILTSTLLTASPPSLLPLITLLTSRINGSAACFNEQAAQPGEWRRAVITLRLEDDDIARWELEPALTQAIQWLVRAPDRFSAAHFSPLLTRVGSSEQAINMLGWCGVCGWLNRLKIALGETY
ncbi:carboxymuconolactone decarboxylase family protein [Salmonella enterica]|uniref:Putative cytoplasmic protein n=1 Tax=Salmonella enterica subsp. salamae TaxID=59202 RepID=A0A6D2G802_SALER|nr:CMD domain-containing protein [Salmonella enterica subsp. enterica]EAR9308607.1 CMD domain-containing protein [Salmonella enterica]ECD9608203.1 CMD domain-containing protein [Salmonella enterica subsp. salamae]EDW0465879.1 CMD domain-containing protein [Salmonella enterica subsp. enterica serovar Victoria]EJU7771093.1 CMD domain-containing protein [Salmonella enterica subsp. salamae serovar 4,12:e,n,x:1,6]HCA3404962.1 CMD domain-containing protein [Salmonella enterica subsp. salamae serovar